MTDIKTWQERAGLSPNYTVPIGDPLCVAMGTEIADLRTALDQRTATAVQMPEVLRYKRDSDGMMVDDQEGGFVFYIDHVAALDARAEEARREGYEQGRFDEQMAQGPSCEEWARIDAERDGQPVAEAAAQADDWITPQVAQNLDRQYRDGFMAGWDAQLDGNEELFAAVQNRVKPLAEYGAAPTAQPTPDQAQEKINAGWRAAAMRAAQDTPKTNAPILEDQGAGVKLAHAGTNAEASLAHPTPAETMRSMSDMTPESIAEERAQPTPPDDERESPTFMDERQAQDWAWKAVRKDCNDGTWTTGESGNYFGFFLHGWRYREQYEKQRRAALRQPGALPDEAEKRPCLHHSSITRWSHLECEDCGAVLGDGSHGIAARIWFKSMAELNFYKQHGRLPEAAAKQAGKEAPAATEQINDKEMK